MNPKDLQQAACSSNPKEINNDLQEDMWQTRLLKSLKAWQIVHLDTTYCFPEISQEHELWGWVRKICLHLQTVKESNCHIEPQGGYRGKEESAHVCILRVRMRDLYASSSSSDAECWLSRVHTRATPSEQAVTRSPFGKKVTSQTQPGCSILWMQDPPAPRKISFCTP